jgi:hypothetical protein
LFPGWAARDAALGACERVANSPDLEDPDAELRQAEALRRESLVINERLDPYSGRFFPRESRSELLSRITKQEREIENIVRDRSWDIIKSKCEGITGEWTAAYKNWTELVKFRSQ